MKTAAFSVLALEAAAAFALPKASSNDLTPRASLNFGRCSDPSITFGVGFDGRTEASFQPNDKAQFNHGSAQNINVIASFICDRFRDSCGASTDAQSACTSAIETIAAEIGQAAADAWNNALGVGSGSGKGVSTTGATSSVVASSSSGPFTNSTQPTGAGAGAGARGSGASPTTVGSGNGGAAGSGTGNGGSTGKGQGGGKGKGGGKGGNKGGKGTSASASASGSGAAPSATGASSATPPSASGTAGGAGGASGSNSNSSALFLDPANVQTGSQSDGQANATAGQSPSATDNANFINFCGGQTLTNGLQVKAGSCNGIVMGQIPATTNMISSVITFPEAGTSSAIKANTDFKISVQVQGLEAGSFTNPDNTYYSSPQQLKGGKVVGHTHVTVQTLGNSLTPTQPPDPTTFVFFKGINDAGDGNGGLQAAVAGGLPAGNYRVCTMTSSSNHQPVLMPVAQRGAQDDCQKFTVQ